MNTKDFLQNISSHLNGVNLRFGEFRGVTKKTITVMLSGRSLNGSYVYEDQQVSSYLDSLRIAFPGSVRYKGGDNVYSWGRYVFEFENMTWNQVGKKYSASGYDAFAVGNGETWAIMHIIYKQSHLDKTKFNKFGITIDDSRKVFFDNKHIYTVTDFTVPSNHHFKGHNTDCSRTKFHASFDCLIKENEMMEIYIELNKRIAEHNIVVQEHTHTLESVSYYHHPHYSPQINFNYSDNSYNFNIRIGDGIAQPILEKTLTNRDILVQSFNVGDTFTDSESNIRTVTNVNYSIKEGFRYGTQYKKGDSTCYSGINQIELSKIIDPTTEIKNDILFELMGRKVFIKEVSRNREYTPYGRDYESHFHPHEFDSFSISDNYVCLNSSSMSNTTKLVIKNLTTARQELEMSEKDLEVIQKYIPQMKEEIAEFNEKIMPIRTKHLGKLIKGMRSDLEGKLSTKTNKEQYLIEHIEKLKMFVDRNNWFVTFMFKHFKKELADDGIKIKETSNAESVGA